MRISSKHTYRVFHATERDDGMPSKDQQRQFSALLGEADDAPKSLVETGGQTCRQHLEACFAALLQGRGVYRDKDIQVNYSHDGKLLWRLLSGPLQGSVLKVSWNKCHIDINFHAAGWQARQLLQISAALQQRLSDSHPSRVITIKVICEHEYS